jgi:hypothetical protein
MAEASERAALAGAAGPGKDTLLLQAFGCYAAAVLGAEAGGWPEDRWRPWRFHRATLARMLADDGRMQQVADRERELTR